MSLALHRLPWGPWGPGIIDGFFRGASGRSHGFSHGAGFHGIPNLSVGTASANPEAKNAFFHEKIETVVGPTYRSGRTVFFQKIAQIILTFRENSGKLKIFMNFCDFFDFSMVRWPKIAAYLAGGKLQKRGTLVSRV